VSKPGRRRSGGKSGQYKWRHYADENIERDVVGALRRAGFDVLSVAEDSALRRHKEDRFHFDKARELGRYLLTSDSDFWSDRQFPGHESPGVIVLSNQSPTTSADLVQMLRKLLTDCNVLPDPLRLDGIKIRLSDQGIDIRMVDHDSQQKTAEHWDWRDLY
jgi:predicted nuclease of predicted toxin-antitoxin system